tara:strand:- start:783 stop:1358 length:576 start_codon:yes stop_codon:yes gene_type:complete
MNEKTLYGVDKSGGNKDEEIWKGVVDYEAYYEVSNKGNIKSVDRVIPHINSVRGMIGKCLKLQYGIYTYVRLSKEGNTKIKTLHRLVASAFLPNRENLPVVNHKNSDKHDNNVNNLEWCTHSYNVLHALENGASRAIGEFNGKSVLTDIQVIDIKYELSIGSSQKSLSLIYNVHPSTISNINTGKCYKDIL